MPTIQEILGQAVQLHQAGRMAEAEKLYRHVLSAQPEHAEALHLLGIVALQAKKYDAAIDLIGRSVRINPNSAEARGNLAVALVAAGRTDEAIVSLREALRLGPNNVSTHVNLANALLSRGRADEAIAEYEEAVRLKPDYFEALANLGVVLSQRGQHEQAAEAHRRAIALRPNLAGLHNNLGNTLRELGRPKEAVESFRRALELTPKYAEAMSNLGAALRDLGRMDETVAVYQKAIALRPEFAAAHTSLGHALLSMGDFERGWAEYEWRWRTERAHLLGQRFSQPAWDGRDLGGATILLHAEQGLGDTIQFSRYTPLVARRGGRVILQCQPELKRLLRNIAGVDQLVARGEALPSFDVHCPLMSLPHALRTTIDTIPATVPYLSAEPELAEQWRARLAGEHGMKVGLVWSGRSAYRDDRRRSLTLSQLAPLARASNVSFYSLQMGEAARQTSDPPPGLRVTDLAPELKDFADTAAVLANLDVLITVDTAAAHLGGATGARTWVLLPSPADFRWMIDREDSPWYPTMRLFRQPQPGEWQTPVARIAEELQMLL